MELQISKENVESNSRLVESLISTTESKKFVRYEYVSEAEFYGYIDIFVLPKCEVKSKFEAFLKLWSFQIHAVEEWRLCETTLQNAQSIRRNFLIPAINRYVFKNMKAAEIENIIFVPEMVQYIKNQLGGSAHLNSKNRIGAYKNGEKMSVIPTLGDLGIHEIISGVGLIVNHDWHEVFYETPESYVYYMW